MIGGGRWRKASNRRMLLDGIGHKPSFFSFFFSLLLLKSRLFWEQGGEPCILATDAGDAKKQFGLLTLRDFGDDGASARRAFFNAREPNDEN